MRVSLRLTLLTILALILGSVVYFSNRSVRAGDTELRTSPTTDRVSWRPGDRNVKDRLVVNATALAPAGIMFGVTNVGDSNEDSTLYSINPSTGEATLIGKVGFAVVSGMDFQPSTGILYATGDRLSDGELVLFTINTVTGQGTEVGPLGSAGGFSNVQDIAFRKSDSILFGCQHGQIITIDTTTGAATLIGDSGESSGGNGLAFSPAGTLYLANKNDGLFTINQSDGSTTHVADLSYSQVLSNPRVSAMKYSPSNSTLYGTVMAGEGSFLATVDTSNGNVSIIGQTADPMDAMAVTSGCIPPPPDMMSFWPGEGNGNDIRGDNNGTVQGTVTFPSGEVEHAFHFDAASNSGVIVPSSNALNPTEGITLDAWVNPSSFPNLGPAVIRRDVNDVGTTQYSLNVGDGINAGVVHCNIGGSAVATGGSVPLSAWSHVACTYDLQFIRAYVNGVEVASTPATDAIPSSSQNLAIGKEDLFTDRNFDGLIDEAELFSRALSAPEIGNIYNAGSFGKCRPRCVTPPSGLVGWWTGDDNPYDIWYPNRNHGTFEHAPSPAYEDGKVGNAFNFNGVDSYVDLDDYFDLQLSGAITIDAWVKPTGIPSGPLEGILTKWGPTASPSPVIQHSYGLWLQKPLLGQGNAAPRPEAGPPVALTLFGQLATDCSNFSLSGGTIPLNVWTHVAMTYDSGGSFFLYVNGSKVAERGPCGIFDANDAKVSIGCEDCGIVGGVNPFLGQIDEVELFDRALSQAEIQAVNNAGFAGKCKPCDPPPFNMVGWWTGDANTRDESFSGNDGTWQGSAAYSFGEVGQAYKFAGDGSAISVPDSTSLDFGGFEFTLDAWVNPDDLTNSPMIFSKWDGANNNSYELHLLPDGSVRANISGDGTSLDSLISSPGVVTTGAWSHVATTFLDGDWFIYVNGVNVGSKTTNISTPFAGTANLLIGRDIGTTHYFTGLIDEAEAFASELSQTEIQSLVAAGPSGKCKGVFSECQGAVKAAQGCPGLRRARAQSVQPDFNETDHLGDCSIDLFDVTLFGNTNYQTLPLYQGGPLPFGYTEPPLEIADITTTTLFNGDAHVCFDLPSVTDLNLFQQLRVLHLEGNVLVDRTSSHNAGPRTLCAIVSSLSPFLIVQNATAAPTAESGSIGGQITDSNGAPLAGVVVSLSGFDSRLTITDSNGRYNFDNVEANGFYTVVPSRVNYTFSPANRSFSLLGVHIEASFTASANSGSHLNPLDTTEYFVRQQYLDFLGREPDPPGFVGWVNTINNCAAGDTSCDRVHVSEMFYRSAEFQERGYFAYRFYSTALGRKPDYVEFMPDLARVSGFLTRDELEAAKVAFIDDFVTRPAFTSTYNSLSNAAYVDKLSQTAGVTLSNRQSLIDALDARRETRAQVLRQVAESAEVYQKYYNQAFVVMEYFGYLRRDPDALYSDWINVLNQSGNARHMVEGFVNSIEYRNRFAQ